MPALTFTPAHILGLGPAALLLAAEFCATHLLSAFPALLQFEGERAVRRLLPKATIFKPGHLIGVEDRLFNNYAQLAKKFPLIPLIDGGHNRLQPVWVRDVADGMVNALKDVDAQGKDYYLAGPNTFT